MAPRGDDQEFATQACACSCDRRGVLGVSLAFGLMTWIKQATAIDVQDPKSIRPQAGDGLVFLSGTRKGERIAPEDLSIGAPPTQAYPIDVLTSTVRDGSRLNMIILARIDPAALDTHTRARSVDGIVAYSAVCTHYGCPITTLHESNSKIVCNCHGSMFDIANGGAVVVGPATRRLAILPVELSKGALVVAQGFAGSLGPPQQ